MNQSAVSWPTALVVAVGIVGVCGMAYFKVDPAVVAAYATVFIPLAGALEKLVQGAKS